MAQTRKSTADKSTPPAVETTPEAAPDTPPTEPVDTSNTDGADEAPGVASASEVQSQRETHDDGRPADGIGSGVRDLSQPPTALASARTPSSGPLSPPDKTQAFEPIAQGDFGEEAGLREFDIIAPDMLNLVDGDGKALTYEDVFEDDGTKTFVTTKVRAYRTFRYPGSDREGLQVQYSHPGKNVSRSEAAQVRHRMNPDEAVKVPGADDAEGSED